jgi:uncharacterized protein YndB with AHSA1/START domain
MPSIRASSTRKREIDQRSTRMTSPSSDADDPVETHAAAKARIPKELSRSVAFGIFQLERTYDASPARVWKALTDPAAKARWFGETSDRFELMERSMDVRPGGRERVRGRWGGSVTSTFEANYYDVIENERLVYSYEMHLDDRKISVSLATIQLKADGKRTRLMIAEQGAFLDGYDDAGAREHGTGELLDALGRSLIG